MTLYSEIESLKGNAENLIERAESKMSGPRIIGGPSKIIQGEQVFKDYNRFREKLSNLAYHLDENTLPEEIVLPEGSTDLVRQETRSRLNKVISECERSIRILEGLERDLESGKLVETDKEDGDSSRVRKILRNMPEAVKSLKNRRKERKSIEINDEYDLQYILKPILISQFDDVREEEYSPSHAGKNPRIDFLIKSSKIGIETKATRPSLSKDKIKNQLSEDFEHYRSHQDCKTLFCLVYDRERIIDNAIEFETDLSGDKGEDLETQVIVVPK